ncbi:hypothetical protein [Larkinella soli]|uniref:hypothetical protein n=1 Tax=Larkinella soli TaxID=1770527 RepID=UPI000FFB70D6|nr:hypothetical protein [Larkinella soli]
MNELLKNLEAVPDLVIVLLCLFLGSAVRAINREAMHLVHALKAFFTGFCFGGVGVGIVMCTAVLLFGYEVYWKMLFWLWFLLAYLGSLIQVAVDRVGDELSRNPMLALRQIFVTLLKQVLTKLETPVKP